MSETEQIRRILEKATIFFKKKECCKCPIRQHCESLSFRFNQCTCIFLSAVLVGLIDLDGNLIDEAEK